MVKSTVLIFIILFSFKITFAQFFRFDYTDNTFFKITNDTIYFLKNNIKIYNKRQFVDDSFYYKILKEDSLIACFDNNFNVNIYDFTGNIKTKFLLQQPFNNFYLLNNGNALTLTLPKSDCILKLCEYDSKNRIVNTINTFFYDSHEFHLGGRLQQPYSFVEKDTIFLLTTIYYFSYYQFDKGCSYHNKEIIHKPHLPISKTLIELEKAKTFKTTLRSDTTTLQMPTLKLSYNDSLLYFHKWPQPNKDTTVIYEFTVISRNFKTLGQFYLYAKFEEFTPTDVFDFNFINNELFVKVNNKDKGVKKYHLKPIPRN